ncbi:hypothetical protein [Microbacterium sp. CIAB417]|uniref:hypothetical protein n=1 Tax=Microbacterium sp. CIAB417 TaxID=2860287 RepID=UPI001FAB8385|nr:hypothetical protein [Microbacterium sp. CIAB417]
MSDPQALPDDERRVDAEGVDPDIPTTGGRPDPDDTSPGEEEDEDDDRIEVEDLP